MINLFHLCCADWHVGVFFAGKEMLCFYPHFLSHVPCLCLISLMYSSLALELYSLKQTKICYHSQGDQPQRWMWWHVKCCKMLKATKNVKLETLAALFFLFLWLTNATNLLHWTSESCGNSCYILSANSSGPRDIMQNLSALGSICVVLHFFQREAWSSEDVPLLVSSGGKIVT